MKHLILAFCSIFIITACGGGGGGGGGSTTPTIIEEPVPVVVNEQTPEEAPLPITLSRINPVSAAGVVTSDAESSSDIVVPNGFDLETEQAFRLGVNNPHTGADAYLSVCTDYTSNADDSFEINYDSCVMRTSLEFQTFETEIAVTNDITNIVAALWFMDTTLEPIYVEWALAEIVE